MQQLSHRWSVWIELPACALIACVLLSMTGCHRTPAEQAIRETIAAMQKASDAHDVGAVVAPLADDFAGNSDEGMRFVQLRESTIHATLGPITIALQGTDRATADFTAVFTGGEGLLPSDGQVEQIHTGWRLDGSKWKLISAEWKASGGNK
jgi:hypothetical protein